MLQSIGESVADVCARFIGFIFGLFVDVGDKIAEVSSFNGGSGGSGAAGTILNSIWGTLNTSVVACIESLQPVGLALCMLFFIISLLELAMSERMTLEYFIKFFSKLIIGVAAVYYAPDIWDCIIKFGDALCSVIGGLPFSMSSSSTNMTEDLVAQLNSNFSELTSTTGAAIWIILLLVCFIMFPFLAIAAVAMTIVAYIVSFSRVLETCVRGIFLPIAVSLLTDDGWRGAGGRYIRKLLSLACQGGVLTLIGKVTTGIMGLAGQNAISNIGTTVEAGITTSTIWSLVGSVLGSFALMLGVGCACISIMFKSIGIVNDVFGG